MAKKGKKKDRRRRKILLSLIMILFVGIVLTASTYAWFTANRSVTVQSIDVNVSTSQGLQISTDATNWKSIINNDDITGASWNGSINQLPSGANTIVPVSTVGAIDENGLQEMYKGSIEAGTTNNILVAQKTTESRGTSGDFIAFDIFIQSSQDQTVYLTSNSSVVAKGTSTGIENAARVSFITVGHANYGQAPSVAQALRATSSSTKWIWEPNSDVHTPAGVSNALNTYGITVTESGASKVTYRGVKAPIADTDAIPLSPNTNNNFFGDVSTIGTVATGIPTTQYLQAFSAQAGVTKLRIYMWIEGQDVDCEDRASGGSLTFSLQFSIDSSAP